jgi:predicted aminopeptidase
MGDVWKRRIARAKRASLTIVRKRRSRRLAPFVPELDGWGVLVEEIGVRRRSAVAVVAIGVAALAGCGNSFYLARLGWTQAHILLSREPIPVLLGRDDLDPALRERLGLVLEAREFARERLGFAVGESFTSFAAIDHDARVWVLSAARRDRLEAHTWWYPIVGRVPYRGFFDRGAAETAGQSLERGGLDVDVRPAVAFSTLGWFADPLLSTTAAGPPVAVVETVLHELFHGTLYLPGRAAFNESAATFAGHRGAIAFFCDGPGAGPSRCTEARRRWAATRARARCLGRFADRLRRLYASRPSPRDRERTRTALAALTAEALVRRGVGAESDVVPPNNARLLGELIYLTDLDTFERLAPDDAGLGAALSGMVDAVRGASDPAATLAALAARPEGR